MKIFDSRKHKHNDEAFRAKLGEAYDYVRAGGQALHLWTPPKDPPKRWPACFKRAAIWGWPLGHLLDQDKDRLERTARDLGVRIVVVSQIGEIGQHIDLVGRPLERAIAICGQDSKASAGK